MNVDIKVVEFGIKKVNLSDYTLIEGFPGLGLVGTIGVKYLIDKMDFKKYGFIYSNVFVPIIRIRDGKPVYPSRIFINEKQKLVVIWSEQIIPKQHLNLFARTIVDWVKAKKFKRVISLNGIRAEGEGESEKIYGIAANDKSKKLLEKAGIKLIEEGITTGITALMLLDFKESNIEAVSLMANVSLPADYKTTANLLVKLNELLNLNLDVSPLLEEAKKAEAELTSYLNKMKETQEKEEAFQPETPSYV